MFTRILRGGGRIPLLAPVSPPEPRGLFYSTTTLAGLITLSPIRYPL